MLRKWKHLLREALQSWGRQRRRRSRNSNNGRRQEQAHFEGKEGWQEEGVSALFSVIFSDSPLHCFVLYNLHLCLFFLCVFGFSELIPSPRRIGTISRLHLCSRSKTWARHSLPVLRVPRWVVSLFLFL